MYVICSLISSYCVQPMDDLLLCTNYGEVTGSRDEFENFHRQALSPFLYFGHSVEHYTMLQPLISKQGWMILLHKMDDFEKNNKFMIELSLIDWERELPDKDKINADKLLKYIKKYY